MTIKKVRMLWQLRAKQDFAQLIYVISSSYNN